MRTLLTLITLALSSTAALAGSSAWTELAPGVRARLISSDLRQPDGTTMAALEIEMPPGTRTYWRVPGETGIPTEFDTGASHGIAAATPLWPYPQLLETAGYIDYVYQGHVVLPLQLQLAGDAPVLATRVTMGICAEVCIPAMADLSLPLDLAKADAGQGIRIGQAVAQTPLPWTGDAAAISDPVAENTGKTIAVAVNDPAIDPMSLIADVGDGGPVFGAPQKSPDGRTVLLPVLGGNAADLVGRPVQLTFQTSDGPYETSRRVVAAGQ